MIEMFKNLLTSFCHKEYGYDCVVDFSDPHHVNFLYTTDGDNEEHTVNVEVDLIDLEYRYLYDDEVVYAMMANDEEQFAEWIHDMDWQEEYSTVLRHKKEV